MMSSGGREGQTSRCMLGLTRHVIFVLLRIVVGQRVVCHADVPEGGRQSARAVKALLLLTSSTAAQCMELTGSAL